MTASEVLQTLVAAGVGKPAAGDSVLVAGIEVAATAASDERAMRREWRELHGGGPTPLLLVADDRSAAGSLLTLGVDRADAPIRIVGSDRLLAALSKLPGIPRLEAVRELVVTLERLDEAGVPGVRLQGLLTTHTLDHRLRTDAERWGRASDIVKEISGGAGWRTILSSLGYQLERRSRRGWLARADGRPVIVIDPRQDVTELSRLDAAGRPPEGILLNECRHDGAPYGLLVAGTRFRLFDMAPGSGSSTASYLELDTEVLHPDDKPLMALLSPMYLAGDQFRRLQAEARQFGATLRTRLDTKLRHDVLPVLARVLGRWATSAGIDVYGEGDRRQLEHAALTAVFRLLFVLYAESAGYLPVGNRTYRGHSLQSLVEEASDTSSELSDRLPGLWRAFTTLVEALRFGNPAWDVPAYNGALLAADGFEGAAILEGVTLTDQEFGTILIALGRDDAGGGLDYSTLDVGHLGHIYEGLLSLRLTVADRPLVYDANKDTYRPSDEGSPDAVAEGDLIWQTNEGGRKAGGVYYTRTELVRHLVDGAVLPAFRRHLESVRATAQTDPTAAADMLLDFAVLDPACGSAHFLVEVVHVLGDEVVRFLAETPLPKMANAIDELRAGSTAGAAIDDTALVRRLVLKRCVFGVDMNPMGAEVAKLSLWMASFVPGLSLAYLNRNVVVGNSLVGVARPEALLASSANNQLSWLDQPLEAALKTAAEAAARVAELADRNPDEVKASEEADTQARAATEGLARVFDLWTAEPFGMGGTRDEVQNHGGDIIAGTADADAVQAHRLADDHSFLHWPVEFPLVFAERAGFDVVVGNPPWEEVTVERLAFYARYRPGIRALAERSREEAIAEMLVERPELEDALAAAQDDFDQQRKYFDAGEYDSMPGDPDLYKFFCARYRTLLRDGGMLGVVLPRTAFLNKGSRGFREWLFEAITTHRVDFLSNRGRWAFDSEPRYTIALVTAEKRAPETEHRVEVAGVADSLKAWQEQSVAPGVPLATESFGDGWVPPLVRDDTEAALLAKLLKGSLFPHGSDARWNCFPVAELHETNDKKLWENATTGWPLWKGESFDQYDPHGAEARPCAPSDKIWAKVHKPRPGTGSLLSQSVPLSTRRDAVRAETTHARVAFRDVARSRDSRTARACLVPPGVFLTNKAPYLAFVTGEERERAACLGIMNSLPFDWQARRFVEINMNFFILELLAVPGLPDEDFDAIANAAARLSCPDERFADFAEATRVAVGPLPEPERIALRLEIDARVARAWSLDPTDLDVIFADFSLDAVTVDYRTALTARLNELS